MALIMDKSLFSRTQTLGIRDAMAAALVRHLQNAEFPGPLGKESIRLNVAYREWPSYEDEYVPNAACVLPGEGRDVDGRLIPTLLEDTWEPQGEPGWGLYVLSDYEVDFEVKIRSASPAERGALVAGIESWFVQEPDDMLIAPARGNRYGLLLDLPEYFASQARFGLKATTVIDDEESAMRGQREATFTIMAQAKKMRVGLVQPFTVKVTVDPDTALTPAPTNQID